MKSGVLLFTALCAFFTASALPAAVSQETAVKEFLDVFLKRPLADAEWQEVLAEDDGKPGGNPQQQIAMLQLATAIMRDQAGTPRDLHLRHGIVRNIVFGGASQSAIGGLLLANDPVVVVDKRVGRLVTLADTLALVRLVQFADTGKRPKDIAPAVSDEVVAEITALRQKLQQGGYMPELASEAAALWAGMEQNWPELDVGDRTALRAFIRQSLDNPQNTLPDTLRINLAGWSRTEVKLAHRTSANQNIMLLMHALGIAGDVPKRRGYPATIGDM